MIELMSSAAITFIVLVAGIYFIVVDTQNSISNMYNTVHGDVLVGTYLAKNTFDSIVRKSSSKSSLSIDSDGEWVEVSYSSDPGSGTIDSYARFYTDQGNLKIDCGQLNPKELLDTRTICANVTSCKFSQSGSSIQMALTLLKKGQMLTVTTSAYLHN